MRLHHTILMGLARLKRRSPVARPMWISKMAAATAVAALLTTAPKANASVIITLEEVGSNVVATATGTIDTADLTLLGSGSASFSIDPGTAFLTVGTGTGFSFMYLYSPISGPSNFGTDLANGPSSSQSGDFFGVFGSPPTPSIGVPSGYVSGSAINGSATWDNTTLAALDVAIGQYVWTWGTGDGADSVTLNVLAPTPVPEPASLAIFGAGLAALGMMRRKRRASQP